MDGSSSSNTGLVTSDMEALSSVGKEALATRLSLSTSTTLFLLITLHQNSNITTMLLLHATYKKTATTTAAAVTTATTITTATTPPTIAGVLLVRARVGCGLSVT